MRPRAFQFGLVALLLVGLALRLAIVASPLGEIDGDEAVVGLMARHIAFLGERPVFYWVSRTWAASRHSRPRRCFASSTRARSS
jgi:hypothetical protein